MNTEKKIRAEIHRASRDGITVEQMDSPIESALHGYLAGLRVALKIARQ